MIARPGPRGRPPSGTIIRVPEQLLVPGAVVVVAGLVSAKDRTVGNTPAVLEARLEALGVTVGARLMQRRGVSDGGVRRLHWPLSRQTVIGPGKVREVAAACTAEGAVAVVFVNPLTARQCELLTDRIGRPVLGPADLPAP